MKVLIFLAALAPIFLLGWFVWRFLATQVLQNDDSECAATEGRSLASTRSIKGTSVREAEGLE